MPCRNWIHLMLWRQPLGEKCLYSELFWSVFSCTQTEFSLNTGKFGWEYLRIRTLFMKWTSMFVRTSVTVNHMWYASNFFKFKFFNFSKNRQFHCKWFTNECTRFNCGNSLDLNTLSFWKFNENKILQVLEPHFSSSLTC